MNLPTSAQVNAVTRHVGTFAAGAITMFGLSSKLDPATIQALIAALGNATNDIILIVGIVTPLVTTYLSGRSASPAAQGASLAATATGPASPAAQQAQAALITATATVAADPTIPKAPEALAVIKKVAS
jgi:predicted lipid-binding transport protein (Tim44 family)